MSYQRKRFDALLSELSSMRHFVLDVLETHNPVIADDAKDDIIFATNEIATNIIEHGYKGLSGEALEIDVDVSDETVTIRLRDDAPSFDPTNPETPDINAPLESRPLGKVGLFLTVEYMDAVRHRKLGDKGNEITLIKELRG